MRERVSAAIALHRSGRLQEAEQIYVEVLQADQDDADALHYLGVLRFQQEQPALAIDLVLRAIELRPDYVDAYNNLGNIYLKYGPADAVTAYQAALELRPDHPDALRNLGIALRKLKRHEEAVELHQRAIEQWPENVENYYALATAYRDLGDPDEAIATLRKALAVKPEAEGFRRLGQTLYGLRRTDEAAAHYEAWLRADPGNPVPRHMLAACTQKDVPTRAEDAFVTEIFDGFAESFDEVLTRRLEYRAPALVGEALKRVDGEPRGELDIVDAGCGTGLLAQYLRPYARRLVGVDLSPKMLQQAAMRTQYDRLIVVELGRFLRSEAEKFDLVASSDTLVYFGDLREVLAAARVALRPGGRLLFTLEHAINEEEVPEGYRIHPHGRYSHTPSYVRRNLVEAGFEVVDIEKVHLRREGQSYVDGLLVTARATSAALALALHRQVQLEYRQGRLLSALNLARRAIQVSPGSGDAHNDLGNIYRRVGVIGGAVEAYQKALKLQPDHPEASHNLAPVLDELKRLEESAEAHRRAFEREPGNADPLYALARVYSDIGRTADELATLRQALAIRPEPDAFRRVGSMLSGMGRLDEVAANYEAWLRAEPQNAIARHMLAACTGRGVPTRAPDGYVTLGFDRFADTFDELLRKLEYRAPALVAAALQRIDGKPRGDLEIIDAGCGTGLLAQHLRPYARRLVGVDLSPKMLEKASGRSVYDELVAAELTSYLRLSPQAFDIVASSDTLNYFGDLREVLTAAGASLRPGGRLLFTLEHAVDEDEVPAGYRIHPDGRYMHTEPYVRGALAGSAFELVEIEKAYLRRDGEVYVAGLVVAARVLHR